MSVKLLHQLTSLGKQFSLKKKKEDVFQCVTAIFVVKQEAHLAASITQLDISLTNSSFQMYDDEVFVCFHLQGGKKEKVCL